MSLDAIFNWEAQNLQIRMGARDDKITSLSGGNQQKVLIGRGFATNPDIMILNDPARGIDVSAKPELYRHLGNFAAQGKSVVYMSSEIEEFIGFCSRVIVFRAGVIFAVFEAAAHRSRDHPGGHVRPNQGDADRRVRHRRDQQTPRPPAALADQGRSEMRAVAQVRRCAARRAPLLQSPSGGSPVATRTHPRTVQRSVSPSRRQRSRLTRSTTSDAANRRQRIFRGPLGGATEISAIATPVPEPIQQGRSSSSSMYLLVPILLFFLLLLVAVLRSPRLIAASGIGSAVIVAVPLILATYALMASTLSGRGTVDLSIGPLIGFINVTLIQIHGAGGLQSPAAFILYAIAAGVAYQILMGLIIVYVRVQPIIVALSGYLALSGINLVILPRPGGTAPDWMQSWGSGERVFSPVLIILLLATAAWIAFTRTAFYGHLRLMGSDERAAYTQRRAHHHRSARRPCHIRHLRGALGDLLHRVDWLRRS